MEANKQAVAVWLETKSQVITVGMGEVIDINILAVDMVMEQYGVRNKIDCRRRVRILFEEYMDILKERSENAKLKD